MAAFEIKTTIDRPELKRAFNQIKEVKSLNYINKKVKVAEYIKDRLNDSTYDTTPPLGIIVGYDHSWSTDETLTSNVLTLSKNFKEQELWDIIYIINKGLILLNYKLDGKPRTITRYSNVDSNESTDLGASFLNFILTANVKLQGKLKCIPEINYREEYNLNDWLWNMRAVSYDMSGQLVEKQR